MSKSDNFSLDFFLTTLLQSREFQSLPHKDWQLISVLVPGTTPTECETRFNELNHEFRVSTDLKLDNAGDERQETFISIPSSRTGASGSSGSSGGTIGANGNADNDGSKPSSRDSQNRHLDKHKQGAAKVRPNAGGASSAGANVGNGGVGGGGIVGAHANMVIHVCDEAKSIKQDFHCPRGLLVKEMKYFAEYLSLETNRCEDVDISVHCDVQIFDWLMRYVKRDGPKTTPKLEPNNAVSILISSDFLKMDSLVQECIDYCAENLEDIVATPCNMNCIQDRLLTTLCNKFNHNQLEALKDKKDKIKSKLFAKKIEQLFDARSDYVDSQYSASTMYKCQYCQKLLIHPIQSAIPCLASRMFVNNRGVIMYKHARDIAWDVNEYLISQIRELKSWRNVYWSVWGLVNCLFCSKCNVTFQVRDLGQCLFHTSRMHVEQGEYDGIFACCGQKSPLFNPLSTPAIATVAGCCIKDHVIDSTARDSRPKMIQDLLKMRAEVCVSHPKPKHQELKDVNIFGNEKLLIPKEESLFDKYSNTVHTPPTGFLTPIKVHTPSPDKEMPVIEFFTGWFNGYQFKPTTQMEPIKISELSGHDFYMDMMPSTDSDTDNDDMSLSGASDDDTVTTTTATTNSATTGTTTTGAGSSNKGRASRFANNAGDDDGNQGRSGAAGQKRSLSKKRRDVSKNRSGGATSVVAQGACSAGGSRKWDQNRSHRWNQDVQRNEDLRRFTEMTYQLAKMRVSSNADKKDLLPPPGGHFARLDWLFRQALSASAKQSASAGMSAGSGSQGYKQGKAKIVQPGAGGIGKGF
ncbi:SANT and BTB domain regulator of class switch recombination-like [Convolutriloba macropyga]|uniref:SANT and BTB domain regulator of class switch recombination-like n=1 Tax=Convolutriloba macropyga TaxID=536237 RepID=UPI003F51DB96